MFRVNAKMFSFGILMEKYNCCLFCQESCSENEQFHLKCHVKLQKKLLFAIKFIEENFNVEHIKTVYQSVSKNGALIFGDIETNTYQMILLFDTDSKLFS